MEKYLTQIKIILSVFGDGFAPLSLSEYIKITPTDFWNKGDEVPLIKGLTRKGNSVPLKKESGWEYSTDYIETLDFEEVAEIIIDKFDEKAFEIEKYVQQKGLNVKIFVVIKIVDGQVPALFFNRKFIELANQLKAEIDTDIYVMSND